MRVVRWIKCEIVSLRLPKRIARPYGDGSGSRAKIPQINNNNRIRHCICRRVATTTTHVRYRHHLISYHSVYVRTYRSICLLVPSFSLSSDDATSICKIYENAHPATAHAYNAPPKIVVLFLFFIIIHDDAHENTNKTDFN